MVVTVSFLFLSLAFFLKLVSADVQPKPSANFPRCGLACAPLSAARLSHRLLTICGRICYCDVHGAGILASFASQASKIFCEADESEGAGRPKVIADLNFPDTDKSFVKLTDVLQVGNCSRLLDRFPLLNFFVSCFI